jgi:predicted metal-dependent phosphoesterase TrpH
MFAAWVTTHAAETSDKSGLRWYRGNTHTHSLWSDGNDFPDMIADWYLSHGYNFLALSDHNILSEGDRWITHDEIVKRKHEDALAKYAQRFGDDWVEQRGTPGTPSHEIRLKPLAEFRKVLEKPGQFLMIQGEEISDKA